MTVIREILPKSERRRLECIVPVLENRRKTNYLLSVALGVSYWCRSQRGWGYGKTCRQRSLKPGFWFLRQPAWYFLIRLKVGLRQVCRDSPSLSRIIIFKQLPWELPGRALKMPQPNKRIDFTNLVVSPIFFLYAADFFLLFFFVTNFKQFLAFSRLRSAFDLQNVLTTDSVWRNLFS